MMAVAPAPRPTCLVPLVLLLAAATAAPTAAAERPITAQSAVGTPPAPGCDPWDALKPLVAANARSLGSNPAAVMLDSLATLLVPHERALETPVQFSVIYLMHSSFWDALAPFNDTAKPILPEAFVARLPPSARTNANMNTVWLHTLLRVMEWWLPAAVPGIKGAMERLTLNPADVSTNTSTMAGIGNFVGGIWAQHGLKDGVNRAGAMEHTHHRANYSDYTLFVPSNTAYELTNVTKWQPLLEHNGLGYFFVQQHITPQIRNATGFSISPTNVANFTVSSTYPESGEMSQETLQALKRHTDEVIAVSANLTDRQKILAEVFDDKLVSLAPVAFWLALNNGWNIHTLLGATMAMNCVYDATIASWSEKIRHNAYAGKLSSGTEQIQGHEWHSYLRTMPHAEYPSGTSSVCAAYGTFMKAFLGSTSLKPEIAIPVPKGCSRREPGKTPAADLPVTLGSIDTLVKECGMSRLHAGVHMMPSIEAGWTLGEAVGKRCFAKYQEIANLGASSGGAPLPQSG